MEDIKERFAKALSEDDTAYIAEFSAGREAAEHSSNGKTPDLEGSTQGFKDGYESQALGVDSDITPVQVGLHPLGGIAIQVSSVTGETAQARITVEQAWNLVGHVNALTGMLIQMAYAQQIQEQQSAQRLIVPGRN